MLSHARLGWAECRQDLDGIGGGRNKRKSQQYSGIATADSSRREVPPRKLKRTGPPETIDVQNKYLSIYIYMYTVGVVII